MNLSLPAASANAGETDRLLLALLLISLAVLALVLILLLRYIVKYRATNPVDRGEGAKKTWVFETSWTAATLLVFFGLFVWGADLYVRLSSPPADALKIYVIAKQWMWKSQHIGGQREINSIHVPVGRPIELVMTSEDVIHDFSVPAFRIKHDVLPGRYETLWFTVTVAGVYPLYCTQFCGLDHSKMVGEVVALAAPRFQQWLAGHASSDSLATAGRKMFLRYGCSGCHRSGSAEGRPGAVSAPSLEGLYGSSVPLADGSFAKADERYLHDSIVLPGQQLVAGYAPIMPSYAGQIDEEDLMALIGYIESLTQGGAE
ncbi:MAG TPA: c-type cytochrome [Steroidobacteraceae bacterium]|jgi:cytochrome c oxidase subunit 2|nr:c-type cytochrome [Steroidobacteraceae bacterium]